MCVLVRSTPCSGARPSLRPGCLTAAPSSPLFSRTREEPATEHLLSCAHPTAAGGRGHTEQLQAGRPVRPSEDGGLRVRPAGRPLAALLATAGSSSWPLPRHQPLHHLPWEEVRGTEGSRRLFHPKALIHLRGTHRDRRIQPPGGACALDTPPPGSACLTSLVDPLWAPRSPSPPLRAGSDVAPFLGPLGAKAPEGQVPPEPQGK